MKTLKSIIAFVIILALAVVMPASCTEAAENTENTTVKKVKTIDKTAYLYTKTKLPLFGDLYDEYRYSYSVSSRECIKVKNDSGTEYCVEPLIVGKNLTKGHTKPVITIYRNIEGEAKQVYKKYRITVKKTPKISQKLNVNKNALKLTKLKDIYSKKLIFEYSDNSVAKIKWDSVLSGNIYESWRWQTGRDGYCVKGLNYGKTRVKVYLKDVNVKVADFKITVKNIKPAIRKKYKTVKLKYSKYGEVEKQTFCVEDIVNDLSKKSKISVKIADKKKADYYVTQPEYRDYDVTMIHAKKLGKTKAEIYETLNGVMRKVGTVRIVVQKATMADAAWNSPFWEEEMDVPEEVRPGDTCDIKNAVKDYWLSYFKKKDYKIIIKSKYPKIASVSKDGILTVLKPRPINGGVRLVEYKIEFSDGSVLKNGIYFDIINNVSDKSGDFEYEMNRDDTINILKYKGDEKKVLIPDTLDGYKVTGIGENAFPYKTTEVTIPSCVTKIDSEAFDYTKISKITVDDGNPKYSSSDDGILYNKDKTSLQRFPPMKKLDSFEVPDGITRLGKDSFYECQVKSVKLPSSVKKIGSYAFASFAGEYDYDYDGNYTPHAHTKSLLTGIILPEGLEEIGKLAFWNAPIKSVTLPESLTVMGQGAFSKSALKSVTVPSGIKELDGTFDGCKSLVKVDLPEGLKKIGSSAFYNCPIKKFKIPSSVTVIDSGSFMGTEEIILPDNLEKIIPSPFNKSLKRISISGKNKYFSTSKNVLYNKNKTELIIYPAGREAERFTIPKTVKKIASYAFERVKIGLIKISGNVREIKRCGFTECKIDKLVIKNGVKKLDSSAFDDCKIGGKVVIPDSVKKYGRDAFCDCNIKSFTIPKCFKKVKRLEFDALRGIREIIIPSYVEFVHKDAFDSMDYYDKKPTVKGKKGTAAEKFAKENKLKFTAVNI